MGKMIDAQSIVVASTATKWYGHEGSILRFVFFHSIALACLVGILVMAQAYVYPFTAMVPDVVATVPAAQLTPEGSGGHVPGPNRSGGSAMITRDQLIAELGRIVGPAPRADRRARHPRLHPRLPLRRRPGRGGGPPRQPRRAVAGAERRDRRRAHRDLPGREHRSHRRLDAPGATTTTARSSSSACAASRAST